MAAGTELDMDYPLRQNIKWNRQFFDKIFVADGHLTQKAKDFYSRFRNVVAIDSPWQDSYVYQYKVCTNEAPEGSWVLHLDADEILSDELRQFICFGKFKADSNIVQLPCVLYITEDGSHFYPAEPWPEDKFKGQWTKSILFKKTSTLDFRHFGSHVIPTHGKDEREEYLPYPYFHLKSIRSFVENDVFQAFLSAPGQGYNEIETARFKALTKQYKTTKEFKQATKDGLWPVGLEKFAFDYRRDFNRPISRLWWTYSILYGHAKSKFRTPESDMTWDNVKHHILSAKTMELYEHNKQNKIGEILIEKDF